jgi:hypothetical protein
MLGAFAAGHAESRLPTRCRCCPLLSLGSCPEDAPATLGDQGCQSSRPQRSRQRLGQATTVVAGGSTVKVESWLPVTIVSPDPSHRVKWGEGIAAPPAACITVGQAVAAIGLSRLPILKVEFALLLIHYLPLTPPGRHSPF